MKTTYGVYTHTHVPHMHMLHCRQNNMCMTLHYTSHTLLPRLVCIPWTGEKSKGIVKHETNAEFQVKHKFLEEYCD